MEKNVYYTHVLLQRMAEYNILYLFLECLTFLRNSVKGSWSWRDIIYKVRALTIWQARRPPRLQSHSQLVGAPSKSFTNQPLAH